MSTDIQQLVEQITDARAAYHELITGRSPRVVIDQNGERVEFTPASRQQLYSYISQLQAQIDEASAVVAYPRGPATVIF